MPVARSSSRYVRGDVRVERIFDYLFVAARNACLPPGSPSMR